MAIAQIREAERRDDQNIGPQGGTLEFAMASRPVARRVTLWDKRFTVVAERMDHLAS